MLKTYRALIQPFSRYAIGWLKQKLYFSTFPDTALLEIARFSLQNLLGCPVGTACTSLSNFNRPINVVFPAPSKPRNTSLAFLLNLIKGTKKKRQNVVFACISFVTFYPPNLLLIDLRRKIKHHPNSPVCSTAILILMTTFLAIPTFALWENSCLSVKIL